MPFPINKWCLSLKSVTTAKYAPIKLRWRETVGFINIPSLLKQIWVCVLSDDFSSHHYISPISSVSQPCLTLWNPMNCSKPGPPVHHQLPEITQTHVHWGNDAIKPSHPLSSPSPLLSIFPRIRVFSNESDLCIRWPKYWSFSFNSSPSMKIQDWSPLGWTGWISMQSKGLSRVFSNTTVQKHQFFGPQLSL